MKGKNDLLHIVKATVKGTKGTAKANVLFDYDTDRSYIEGDILKKIA